MGYTSTVRKLTEFNRYYYSQAPMSVTAASSLALFTMPVKTLLRQFDLVEVCDNGKLYLRSEKGPDWVCLERDSVCPKCKETFNPDDYAFERPKDAKLVYGCPGCEAIYESKEELR